MMSVGTQSGMKTLILTFIAAPLQALIIFAAAGHARMVGAWVYLALYVVLWGGGTYILYRHNQILLYHRGEWKKKKDTKSWDKIILPLYGMLAYYVTLIVSALDVGRFQWSVLGMRWLYAGVLLYVIGTALLFWSMYVNTFFEATVRLQQDRGHQVITTGPYHHVRHPGYAGVILQSIALPLLLGSGYGLMAALIAVALLILRTELEDRFLQRELEGYSQYAVVVNYKLVPYIW
jgi:protein-S-isoprenylcysteine O-methyltransferase Ste14